MGIRIEVEEGEPIEDALRRFREQILAEGGYPLILACKWQKRSPRFYLKPSVLNRRRRWITRVTMIAYLNRRSCSFVPSYPDPPGCMSAKLGSGAITSHGKETPRRYLSASLA